MHLLPAWGLLSTFLQKAWGIRNAYTSIVLLLLMFLSPPLRGVGLMALMLGLEWQHMYIVLSRFDSEIIDDN
jgi:hypothetical protein